ncbi:MAG: hypothetical protein IJM37_05590 [Lachnospiraceae bacterium]|nr:hypothetical protein [Lachnospiraceae bacterium]
MKVLKRVLAVFLSMFIITGAVPLDGLTPHVKADNDDGMPEVLNTDSGTIEVSDDWNEAFKYGTFAFDVSEAVVEEGKDTLNINLYRLGGTLGRATAIVRYSPVLVPVGEDKYGYSTASSTDDIIIEVEDALPIAQYQPVGKRPDGEPAGAVLSKSENGEDYIIALNEKADEFQWQILEGKRWKDVLGAVEDTFTISKEDYEAADFRCIYYRDNTYYCTDSVKGVVYEKPEEEVLPEMPDNLDLNPPKSYTKLVADENDPYLAYDLYLTFADGESMKSIRISAPEDDISECIRQGVLIITDCEGGSVYDTANTIIFSTVDNDAPEPFEIGFDVTEVKADKAEGYVDVTVRRTGGNQTMVAVTYESSDDTAKKGVDYEAVSGEMSFYGDAMEQVIRVPLIDNGMADDEEKSFILTLTGIKGDSNEIGALTQTQAVINLYNSGEGEDTNLATMLSDPEAIDISENTEELDKSVVDISPEAVSGEQTDAAEPINAQIAGMDGTTGGGPLRSFFYGRLGFSRDIEDYENKYWTKYYDVVEEGLAWSKGKATGEGWMLSDDENATATLKIDNMAQMYESFYGSYKYNPEWASDWSCMWYGAEFVYPWAAINKSDGSRYAYTDCGYNLSGSYPSWNLSYHSTGTLFSDWSMDSGVNSLVLGLSEYDAHGSDDDASCTITTGELTRREFSGNLNLMIHTANDGESDGLNICTAPDGAAMLTTDSGVYASMKPTVELIEKESGVTWGGKLYVGSKLKVSLNKTASYFPYKGEELSAAVYLTSSDGSIVNAEIKRQGDTDDYTVTMLWNGINESELEDTYTINIVMTRKQNLKIDLTPSVEHMRDEDGNTLSSIDTDKISDAEALFWNSGKGEITIGYSAFTKEAPHYETKITQVALSNYSRDGAVISGKNIPENIQWINFNRNHEDRILFNGRMYFGDSTIWLRVSDLSLANLSFIYYNKDYLSASSIMSASIDSVGLYWDGDANGRIDGKYDTKTGYFIIDEGSRDEFLMFLDPNKEYTETLFNYTKNEDGELGEMYLKVFYTMTPRALAPEPHNERLTAQVIPALSTSITDPEGYAKLTDELQDYRYILSGKNNKGLYTSDRHPMFGANASAIQYVDVPLGGDKSPVEPVMVDKVQKYIWNPDYQGNLLYPYDSPEPIFIENSLAGHSIPLAREARIEGGKFVMSDVDIANLNGYLGSFVGNSTIALCVQQQVVSMDQMIANPDKNKPKPESSSLISNNTTPDASYLSQVGSGNEAANGGFDMDDSGSSMSEFNINLNTKIPKSRFGDMPYDFISYSYNGLEHIVSFSIPIASWKQGKGVKGPIDSIKNNLKKFENCKNIYFGPEGLLYSDDSYSDAVEQGKYTSKGFNAILVVTAAILFKYDPVENEFVFKQFSGGFKGTLQYTYMHRFVFCPALYICIKVGITVSVSSGGTFKPKTVETAPFANEATGNGLKINKGEFYVFQVQYKAINIKFKGKVGLELYEDIECTKKLPNANMGFLKSSGDDTVTATMVRKDGYDLDGKTCYLKVSALEDTDIKYLAMIKDQSYDLYWSGIKFDPTFFVNVAGGIGVELMKFEIYVKFSAGVSMTFFPTSEKDYSFDSATFAIALGFKVVFLFFSQGMDLIGYSIKYDGKKDQWSHSWSAIGDKYGGQIGVLSMRDSKGNVYDAKLKLPGDTADTQTIYKQQEEVKPNMLKAYQANDVSVPFELGGYSGSSDAVKLADGLTSGYDYKVVTIDDENYVLYHISREKAESTLDKTMLVLSKLKMRGVQPGFVNPVDETDVTPYIIVDVLEDGTDDGTGDLDFYAKESDGGLYVTWVSYDTPAKPADSSTLKTLDNAAKNTVVKTAYYLPGDESFTPAVKVSGKTGANVAIPASASDAVVYIRSNHLTDDEIETRTDMLADYLSKTGFDAASSDEAISEIAKQRIGMQRAAWTVNGGNSEICVSIGEKPVSVISLSDGVTVDNIETTDIDGTYYVAYTTSESCYTNASGTKTEKTDEIENRLTIKRLYLRTFTVEKDKVKWGQKGKAVLLRTLYDFDNNDSILDGVYKNGVRSEQRNDPWFGNLQFLNANLGNALSGEEESFLLKSGNTEHFLLFDMNGATYLIKEDSLKNIATAQSGSIIPFFRADTSDAEDSAEAYVATGRNETTIGVDGNGNLAAIYTSGVEGTLDNALWLTKFDPVTGSWGAGTMLAMNHMSVYEDNLRENRSQDDAENAYLGLLKDYDKGSLDYFVFKNPQIALGQTADTLLVLTQGSMGYLKETGDAEYPVITVPDEKVTAREYPRSKNAPAGVGVYAIGYGVGQQAVGNGYIDMPIYDFSAGAYLYANIGFTNTGDVGIRGSKDQPIEVSLQAQNDSGTSVLAEWTVTQNIIPGQQVNLKGYLDIPETLTDGTKILIRVRESDYYKETGGMPFDALTDPVFTINNCAELGIADSSINLADVDEQGNAVIDLEFTAGNRGTIDAQNVKAVFSFDTGFTDEDGKPVYAPLDLTNATFDTADVHLKAALRGGRADGIYDIGTILPGYGKIVTGRIAVPSECFNDIATGGLSLKIELFSDADEITVTDMGVTEGTHNEYNTLDNAWTTGVEHRTVFTAPARLSVPMGNTLRIPVRVRYTTGDEQPRILVTEFSDHQDEEHLGIKSFKYGSFENGMGSGTLVLAPSGEGSGFIRILDTNTNSFFDIAYSVTPTAEGINIFNDNALFTFYNADGTAYDASELINTQGWTFDGIVPLWGNDGTEPYLGNLSNGKLGSSFKFTTQAESISFTFDGEVKVESDFEGFKPVTISASGGDGNENGEFATVYFGENPENMPHTVTVTVTGTVDSTGYAFFDRLIETFSDEGGIPVPAQDDDAPHIYYSRSFPDTASVENGEEVKLQAFIMDDTGLSSVALNSKIPESITKQDDTFWTVDLVFTENGTYTFDAVDDVGNRTVHTIDVDWFNTQTTYGASSEVPDVDATLMKRGNGSQTDVPLTDDVSFNNKDSAYIETSATASDGSDTAVITVECITAAADGGLTSDIVSPLADKTYPAARNGWYLVRANDPAPNENRWAQTVVYMTRIDTNTFDATLEPSEDGKALDWSVLRENAGNFKKTVKLVTFNGMPLEIEEGQTYLTGSIPVYYNGDYTLHAEDTLTNTAEDSYSVSGIPVALKEGCTKKELISVTKVGHTNKGSININPDALCGGFYDPDAGDIAAGNYVGRYEYVLQKEKDALTIAEMVKDGEWTTKTTFDELGASHYLLYVRDALDPDNAEEVASFSITVGTEAIVHDWDEGVVIKEATCISDGKIKYTCPTCGKTKTEVIPMEPDKHTWNDGDITTEPTCISEGVKTFTCEICKKTRTEVLAINPDNHVHVRTIKAVEPTCTESGYTEGIYCDDCKKYVSGHKEVPAHGHILPEGWESGYCLRCNEFIGDDIIRAPKVTLTVSEDMMALLWGASKADWDISADTIKNVTLNGMLLVIDKGQKKVSGEIPLSYNGYYSLIAEDTGNRTSKADCMVNGIKVSLKDGKSIKDLISVTNVGHTNKGSISLDEAALTGGFYDAAASNPAEGKYIGRYEYVLLKADEAASVADVLKEDVWTDETAFDELDAGDYIIYVRDALEPDNADEVAVFNVTVGTDEIVHDWDEGRITKEPTCIEDGERLFTCPTCGKTKTEVIPMDPDKHTWNEGEISKEATCVNEGEKIFTCEVCKDTKTVPLPVNPDNHVHVKDVEAIEPTCTETGYTDGVYCEDCEKYISGHEEVPAYGHILLEGWESGYCQRCKEFIGDDSILAPEVSLKISDDRKKLLWSASKADWDISDGTVKSVMINGVPVWIIEGQKQLSGEIPLSYNGDYVLTAVDSDSRTSKAECHVEGIKVSLAEGKAFEDFITVTNVGHTNKGSIKLDPDALTGGFYDSEAGNQAEGKYIGRYEYMLCKADEDISVEELVKNEAWSDDTDFDKLEAGDYIVYVRDALDAENIDSVVKFNVTVGTETIVHDWDDGTITRTPTCVEEGTKTFTCSICGETRIEQLAKNPDNHVHTKNVPAKESTCTEKGYTSGIYCEDCGKYISGHQETAALGHILPEGKDKGRCQRCGENIGGWLPITGDSNNLAVYIILMAIAAIVVTSLLVIKKKRRR